MQRRQKTSLKNLLHSGANDRRGGGAAKPVTFQQVLTNGLQRQQAKGLMGQHGLTLGQRRLFLPRLTTTISTSRTCVKLNHKNWTSISIKMNDTLIKGQTSSSFSLLNKMLFYSVLYHNWRHVFGVLSTFLTFQKNALHISTNITLGWSFLSFSPSPLARQRRTIHGQKTLRSMENKKNREQGLFGMPRYLEQTDKKQTSWPKRNGTKFLLASKLIWNPTQSRDKNIPIVPVALKKPFFCIQSMFYCQVKEHCYRLAGNAKPTYQ